MTGRRTYANGRVFDGRRFREDCSVMVTDGTITSISPAEPEGIIVDLEGDILAPGFVDLQVNGGGGVLLNDVPTLDGLRRIASAQSELGATTILPTLITDRPQVVAAAIAATSAAIAAGVPGIAGLHLEGPHLSVEKYGAHDPALVRPMRDADLDELVAAAGTLPCLKVTLAPESATPEQIATLAKAGVYVALGHSNCDAETARRAFDAGARGVTHLFNAMSQMTARAPGLVGAALAGEVWAGLIADGRHVDPLVIRCALRANHRLFLVSDAMAVAGTDLDAFTLGDRRILRRNGELRLADGTLAGADLDLVRAVSVLVQECGEPLAQALARATRLPAEAADLGAGVGLLEAGTALRAVRLRETPEGLRLVAVYY